MSDIKLTKEEERVIWEWLLTNIGDGDMFHELDQKELIFKCCSSHRSFGILPSELFQIFNTQMKESIIYLPLGQNEMLKLIEFFRIQLSGEAVEYLESKYPIIIFRTLTGRISCVDSYKPVNIRWRRLMSNPDEMAALDVDKDVPLSLIKLIPIKLDMKTMKSTEVQMNVKLNMGGGILEIWEYK